MARGVDARAACALGGMILALAGACSRDATPAPLATPSPPSGSSSAPPPSAPSGAGAPRLPLCLVADVELPGSAVRFDYQDVDATRGLLVVAHMNEGTVLFARLSDGAPLGVVPGVPRARGVAIAPELGKAFVTSSPNHVVVIDEASRAIEATLVAGSAPDGIAWDGAHRVVAVSDQRDGAVSLLADSGKGKRASVHLGTETGNVIFDAPRGLVWVTVVGGAPVDRLVAIDPVAASVTKTIALPGCDGAHGLRVAPDGASALVACEGNSRVARVDLAGSLPVVTAPSGADPDVLAIDPGLGWLYVAAESGDVAIFDLRAPGLARLGSEHPGDHAHTVAVDPATHRVFFPLESGPNKKPTLRILAPTGT